MTTVRRRDVGHWFPRMMALAAAVIFLSFGLWAMVAPRAFFDAIAVFEPYNQHFIQDIGAFQIGLGAVLGLAWATGGADAIAVGSVGAGVGSLAHGVSHVIGADLGGNPGVDIPTFLVLGLTLVAAGVWRWRERSPADRTGSAAR
ncbi:MAG TPA: hypothetical protein VMS74_00140 [Acidimicrobiia bacterium]|nr:hypothetical protein [Acidimicrobiia bacterium]